MRTGDELQLIRLYGLHLGGREFTSARIYRVRGGKGPEGWVERDARVRVKSTGQLGTVRGATDTPTGRRYEVLYDLEPDATAPLSANSPRPLPAAETVSASDIDFLYAVRPGGTPERPPLIAQPA